MSGLSDELFAIYRTGLNRCLQRYDEMYGKALERAGLHKYATTLPEDKRQAFEDAMRVYAWLGAKVVHDANSLIPSTIHAGVIAGPVNIYRVSQRGDDRPGIWWFGETVALRCRQEAGSTGADQLEWLRNLLAVCFNWSTFDQFQRIQIPTGLQVPAVFGKGAPMPYYMGKPYQDKIGRRVSDWPKDYWQQKGRMLLGGESQIVLPWVPHRIITPIQQL